MYAISKLSSQVTFARLKGRSKCRPLCQRLLYWYTSTYSYTHAVPRTLSSLRYYKSTYSTTSVINYAFKVNLVWHFGHFGYKIAWFSYTLMTDGLTTVNGSLNSYQSWLASLIQYFNNYMSCEIMFMLCRTNGFNQRLGAPFTTQNV